MTNWPMAAIDPSPMLRVSFARIEPVTSDTLVAFAAKAGSTAADGDSVHSPFTAALMKHIATPGLDVRIAFGRVRDDVLKSTANRQEPFLYGSLGGSNVALVSLTTDNRVEIPSIDPNARVAREYDAAAKVGTKEAWDAFLATHPTGFYADLARAQRANIGLRQQPATPSTKLSAIPPTPINTDKKSPKEKGKNQKASSSQSWSQCCATFYRKLGFTSIQIPMACQNARSVSLKGCGGA
jgi:hypothetical protein